MRFETLNASTWSAGSGVALAIVHIFTVAAAQVSVRTEVESEIHPVGETFFAVVVEDDSLSASWYESIFGLTEANHLRGDDGAYSIRILSRAGLTVEVIRLRQAREAEDRSLGLFKVGFFVTDLDTAHAFLMRQGVDSDEQIFTDEALMTRSFLLRDPDGNRIQLFERCEGVCP